MSTKTFDVGRSVSVLIALVLTLIVWSPLLWSQTLTTGAISGTVTDPSGAVVPHASVTATNIETGTARSTTTGEAGGYIVPFLNPGNYRVTVKASGFSTQEEGPITVALTETATVNFKLTVGVATQTVEVTEAAPLIETDNPNTTTSLSTQAIDAIPNPGMDLSYEANFAPGAVMNTTGGYGNVEFNGLPSVSNNFTIDGLDANDPFLNLNNSGATNLQLGLNAVQEVSINTNSYSVDQGRLGAAQINYVSKSGTNAFHGAASEVWNGSKLNAADFFINSHSQGPGTNPKPFSNINEFTANAGGPIVKDKLFFYGDFEGIFIALPLSLGATVPTQAYQNYVLGQLATGTGCEYQYDPGDCAAGTAPGYYTYAGQSGAVPFYQKMFSIYNNLKHPSSSVPMYGCNMDVNGNLLPVPSVATPGASIPDGSGCGLSMTYAGSNHTHDNYEKVRVDYNMGSKDTIWVDGSKEHGLQATTTDPLGPIFNQQSDQPQWNGAAGWTHTFSPSVVNQFNPGFTWYSAIFEPPSLSQALAAFPITFYGPFSAMNNLLPYFPQGRNVNQYQFNDNVSWTKGKNEFKFGENMRRVLVSDYGFQGNTFGYSQTCTFPQFALGISCYSNENFYASADEPFGIINLDMYFQDTLKATSKLTLTLGVRATWNSNPVDQQNLVARPDGSYYTFSHDVTQPLNSVIKTGLADVLPSTPLLAWQPRGAVAYQIDSRTVFRGGLGVFSDIFPAAFADSMAHNPPYDNDFSGGLFGSSYTIGLFPGVANSSIDVLKQDNQQFLSLFSGGGISCNAPGVNQNNCLPQVGLTAVEHYVKYPYFLEWSAGFQHELATNMGLEAKYVGTRAVQIPYQISPNGFQNVCQGCFAPWPYVAGGTSTNNAPDARFSGVTQWTSGAGSMYNALQLSLKKRMSRGLQTELNYTWSHCLDTISNGGVFGFGGANGNVGNAWPGRLYQNYANCDYDYRHVFNAFYTYQLPFHASNNVVSRIVNGWQVSGSWFAHDGQPMSAFSGPAGGTTYETSGPWYANQVPGVPQYYKGNLPGITNFGNVQWLNPNAFMGLVDPATALCVAAPGPGPNGVSAALAAEGNTAANCQQGNMGRNTLRGPGFFWSDLFLEKRINLTERMRLAIAGQFYNIFNHPNFGNPGGCAGAAFNNSTNAGCGQIGGEVSPPTGLLGSFLGGDSAVRMIAFKAKFEW